MQPQLSVTLQLAALAGFLFATVPLQSFGAVAVRNASMTDGGEIPEGWTNRWAGSGSVRVARDTRYFHSAPAALRVDSVGGAAQGCAHQIIECRGGDCLRVSGWVRGGRKAAALVGVQSYDKDGRAIEFTAIGNALPGSDWQLAVGEVELPQSAARFAIVLRIEGDGSVWMDDVSVEPIGRCEVKPKVPAPPKASNR